MSLSENISASKFCFKHIVLQPTTLCNLNCDYCYLPDKQEQNKMPHGVAEAVAESIKHTPHPLTILWHGGEPLACGIEHFKKLLEPFEELRLAGKLSHNIQINGTMISPDWCRLLKEKNFSVGLSIDGPEGCNINRINRANMPAWDRIMKGIGLLKLNRIPFGVIAVVTRENIKNAKGFYEFFSSLGCRRLCVNIVEPEGVNMEKNHLEKDDVKKFWCELFECWRENPAINIREFTRALGWLGSLSTGGNGGNYSRRDMLPTVAWNGDVLMLSPEFLSVEKENRESFVVGNVLDKPLEEIVIGSFKTGYVKDYFAGVKECAATCEYFGYCGGGQASNKYFELGKINATETQECHNTKKLLLECVSSAGHLEHEESAELLKHPGFDKEHPEAVLGSNEDSSDAAWSDWADSFQN